MLGDSNRDPVFADCNAVSPETLQQIAEVAGRYSVKFQDVGIVGAAPRDDRPAVRFYTSGPHYDVLSRIATTGVDVRDLGESLGRASAFKMVYASLTKGTHALRAAAMLAGESLGVGEEIRREWQSSLPDTYQAMEKRLPGLPSVSGRWEGEMREIAATYRSLGITPGFHEAAGWMYQLLADTPLAEETRKEAAENPSSIEQTLAAMTEALARRDETT